MEINNITEYYILLGLLNSKYKERRILKNNGGSIREIQSEIMEMYPERKINHVAVSKVINYLKSNGAISENSKLNGEGHAVRSYLIKEEEVFRIMEDIELYKETKKVINNENFLIPR